MSQKARNLCAMVCLLWIGNGVIRVVAVFHGHPGDKASLALAVVSGAFALVGFGAYALRRRP